MMNYIVAYDIGDPRRLHRVAKVMEDYGHRVQQSIFEVSLGRFRFDEMKHQIEQEIVASMDGVKYFPRCEKCVGSTTVIGMGLILDRERGYEIV